MPRTDPVSALSGIAMVLAAFAFPAVAQPPSDFQRQLQERDAIIIDLMRRVEALERQLSTQQRTTAPSATPTGPGRGETRTTRGASAPEEDETVARALERALVIQGGQVLPPFTYEIGPEFQYSSTRTSQLGIVDGTSVAQVTTRRDFMSANALFRAGLPYDSQIDVRIPFVWDSTETSFLNATTERSDAGLGDIDVTLFKQMLYERGWLPDLIANLRWKTSSGRAEFSTLGRVEGTGSGFNTLSGALTAVKRQDPLVFLGGVGYTYVFDDEKNGVNFEPGDSIDLRLATILAASPDTSLRLALSTSFVQETKIDDVGIAGSDNVASILEIAASSVITPSLLLDLGVGVGLTDSVPDFLVTLSLPYRF